MILISALTSTNQPVTLRSCNLLTVRLVPMITVIIEINKNIASAIRVTVTDYTYGATSKESRHKIL